MASPAARFRPALLTVLSLAGLVGYLFLAESTRGRISYFWPSPWLVFGFLGAAVAAPLLYVARIVARARQAITGDDAFARLRAWAERRSGALLGATVLPALLASFDDAFITMFRTTVLSVPQALAYLLGLWIVPSVGLGVLGRALVRGALAPLHRETAPAPAERFAFSAVAVTPEARAAVAGVFAVTVAMAILAANLEHQLLYSPGGAAGLLAYVAVIMGVSVAFQRASRIGLGFDGVLVTGSSRTRFFAYHDVDAVQATRGGDVLLLRNDRVVLRLQLHGEDQGRHEAIAERIREGLAHARAPRGGGAARLADALGTASLARAAQGLGSFRAPGVTRDELWELVEAPGTAATSRAAAAEALASGADPADRTRMRVAAERCAEPLARSVLTRVAGVEEGEEEEPAERPDPRRMRREAPREPADR